MIIVLKPGCSEEQIAHILAKIEEFGLRNEVSRGVKRTLIGVIGEEDLVRNAPLKAIPGVEEVLTVLKPFMLASREFQEEDSAFDVGFGV
ncbi:MAG: 3-deoxy-7-phosphoheptulonate synthase, partial [Planctomycetaceae bacterium]